MSSRRRCCRVGSRSCISGSTGGSLHSSCAHARMRFVCLADCEIRVLFSGPPFSRWGARRSARRRSRATAPRGGRLPAASSSRASRLRAIWTSARRSCARLRWQSWPLRPSARLEQHEQGAAARPYKPRYYICSPRFEGTPCRFYAFAPTHVFPANLRSLARESWVCGRHCVGAGSAHGDATSVVQARYGRALPPTAPCGRLGNLPTLTYAAAWALCARHWCPKLWMAHRVALVAHIRRVFRGGPRGDVE